MWAGRSASRCSRRQDDRDDGAHLGNARLPPTPDGTGDGRLRGLRQARGRRVERCPLHARARLDEIVEGRKLRFAVEVVIREGRTIGVGTHERRVSQRGRNRNEVLGRWRGDRVASAARRQQRRPWPGSTPFPVQLRVAKQAGASRPHPRAEARSHPSRCSATPTLCLRPRRRNDWSRAWLASTLARHRRRSWSITRHPGGAPGQYVPSTICRGAPAN